jgi:hypothetical protein
MDGPGVWVSCIKGKERLAVNEIIAAFEEVHCMRILDICAHLYDAFV